MPPAASQPWPRTSRYHFPGSTDYIADVVATLGADALLSVVRFAEDDVIFIADLVVPNRVGFGNLPDFFPAEWERTLAEIQELEYDTVMFTHGAPSGPASAVAVQLEFLQDMRAGIFAALQAGTPFLAVPDALELPQYAEWDGYDEWLSLNAWRVLMEIAMGW